MELSILLIWAGCLSAYLGSSQQTFLYSALTKPLAWSGFALLCAVALWHSSFYYSVISAFLLCFSLVMLCWLTIILLAGYDRVPQASGLLSVLVTLIFAIKTGVFYVV